MPKLVAMYLREFSYNAEGAPSLLYRLIFCVCLPFVSTTFRKARLNALAIAECTDSVDQITRVLKAITGADLFIGNNAMDYYVSYDGTSPGLLTYDASYSTPIVPYGDPTNAVIGSVTLNGAAKTDVEAYLSLLTPFYIDLIITNWID